MLTRFAGTQNYLLGADTTVALVSILVAVSLIGLVVFLRRKSDDAPSQPPSVETSDAGPALELQDSTDSHADSFRIL